MDKVMALLVSSAVLLMSAVIVIFTGNNSLLGFDENTDTLENNQKCQFQVNQLEEDNMDALDSDCVEYIEDDDLRDRAVAEASGIPTE